MRIKNHLKILTTATLLALSLPMTSAFAALPVGANAPDFKLEAALAGKQPSPCSRRCKKARSCFIFSQRRLVPVVR